MQATWYLQFLASDGSLVAESMSETSFTPPQMLSWWLSVSKALFRTTAMAMLDMYFTTPLDTTDA